MKSLVFASLAPALLATTALLATGCGNTVVDTSGGGGDSGGGGSGGSTTTSTTSTVPPECAVSTSEDPPYSVSFQLTNISNQPLYLRQDCSLNYSVKSCADGYTESLGLSGACTSDCADQNTCVQCGACPENAVLVASGDPVTDSWNGETFTFGQTVTGCTCHEKHLAPAGKYRIIVPVFPTEDTAISGSNFFEVSTDFELPAPNGVVEVQLYLPQK